MNSENVSLNTEIEISNLFKDHADGNCLSRSFYTSRAIYERDIERFWNASWIWVGHTSQLPNAGDFFLFEYGNESIIIVRDRDKEINAFLNVCKHRGSRICLEQNGNRRLFVCPYHAWTYELNGDLRSAREMGPNFNSNKFSLLKANVRIFYGLIFVCTANIPPNIELGLAKLAPLVAPFQLENLKIAHSATYTVPANWKLAVENYMECYHCAPSHKEYAKSHSIKDPEHLTKDLINALQEKSLGVGLKSEIISLNTFSDDVSKMDFYHRRYPLFEGYLTGSRSGKPIAPLLGCLSGFDGGATDLQVGILNNFLIYSDYMVGYRFIPRELQKTDMEIVWFVKADAVEDKHYNKTELTWLWDVTSQDDERIIRLNQKGVNSYFYSPGPLSTMEWGISAFYADYLSKLVSDS